MAIAREGLAIMAGLYWDLGDGGTPSLERGANLTLKAPPPRRSSR